MRKKRGSALGEKFVPGAEITNMEGLMHTFVVPVVPRCETAGDYCFSFGHRVTPPIVEQIDGEGSGIWEVFRCRRRRRVVAGPFGGDCG